MKKFLLPKLFKFILYCLGLFLGTYLVWSLTQEKKTLSFGTYWFGLAIITATFIWHYIRENPRVKIIKLIWFIAKCSLLLLIIAFIVGDNDHSGTR